MMAQQKKYKDIGKKDLMNVMSQIIQKVEAMEITLNSDRDGDTPRDNKD